jgi:anti-anti-sigma factor
MALFTKIDTANGHPCELVVKGEIDLAVAGDLVAAALGCLSTDSPGLIIDLSPITFLDAAGINALVRIHGAAQGAAKTLVLANPPAQVIRLLQITGLDTWFCMDAEPAPAVDFGRLTRGA